MSKRIGLWALGLAVSAGLAAGEAAAFSATYDQKATQGRQVFVSKVSVKDDLFKLDTKIQGQVSTIIHNDQGTFIVMPSEGMAMKTNLMQGQGPVAGGDNYAGYLQQNSAQQVGTETVNGKACNVYKFTDPSTDSPTTAWVATDIMFPVKLEIEAKDGTMVVELSNIQLDANIPDSEFKLPAGVQVMDMGAMMGGMQ